MRFLPAFLALICTSAALAADLRIGIIGCDTSHVTAFTEVLNNPAAKGHVPGGKVVAAYKGGSADIPSSINRVEEYSKTLREKYGVKFYDTIEEMSANVDVVLLESVDGRPHLEQVKPVLKAGKPVFIDKPMAASLHDAIEMFRLAKAAHVPIFSSSSLRFAKANQAIRNGSIGKVTYAETYGPCELEPHHPDLFWYGVHGVEALFTVMGTGCETVQRGTTTNGMIEVTGTWKSGRKGLYPLLESIGIWSSPRTGVFRANKSFHGLARGDKGEAPAGTFDGYQPLVVAIMKFFQTGIAPVKPAETIQIIAFMEAADLSKQQGGAPIKLRDLIKQNGG
jgi:Oxidoreductase family, NAD-binding Rossmann fold